MILYLYFFHNSEVIPLIICLNFSSILFVISLVGIVFNKRNIIVMLLCIELMFFSISLNFIFLSIYCFNLVGQIYCLLIITVCASETAIGLSLLIVASRLGNKINYKSLINLRN